MELFDEVKLYLNITWSDEHTDDKVTGIIARGQDKLRSYAGNPELGFPEGTAERQLLLDYCRYIWNNAGEDFEDNYRADLIMLRAAHQISTEGIGDESETANSGADS